MGFFSRGPTDVELEAKKDELKDQIEHLQGVIVDLNGEIRGLRAERGDYATRDQLQKEIEQLRKDKVTAEIEQDRLKENHEREKREVEHKVGLQQQTVDFQIDKARREVELEVRENNLAEDRRRFEENLAFNTERLENHMADFKELNVALLERLPKVNVEMNSGGSAKSD